MKSLLINVTVYCLQLNINSKKDEHEIIEIYRVEEITINNSSIELKNQLIEILTTITTTKITKRVI